MIREDFLRAVVFKLILVLCAKSLQSCPTLCDPIDGSPPGSSIHGIFQAGVLEWGAILESIKELVRQGREGREF